jgi:adenosylmethionine-8-amino-7-oxononanoate aminotransferase
MSLASRDQQVIWHPFTRQKDMAPNLPIASAAGTLLIAEDGKTYIDAISSWWVTLHGHAHPYIAEKIYRQALKLEQVIFAGFTHEPAVALAERLLPLLPGPFSRIFYSDNGSTSTEVALKMAVQYWWNNGQSQRKKIIAFRNSYHGDTFGAMSVSDRSVFTLAFHDLLFEVVFIDTPDNGNIDSLCTIIEKNSDSAAAFIYEPLVQGAGGMRMYEAALLEKLLASAQAAGIICIADEVMTGFGRTGKMFASDYLSLKPDIVCLSKGLTGGTMALGVTACTDRIYQAYLSDDKYKTFFHGHSFTANPLACTAALASLELWAQNKCEEKVSELALENKKFAEELVHSNWSVRQVRTLGTILAFEIAEGKDEYLNELSATVTAMALEAGVYLRPLGNTVYIMPPYCVSADELNSIYNCIRTILEKISVGRERPAP